MIEDGIRVDPEVKANWKVNPAYDPMVVADRPLFRVSGSASDRARAKGARPPAELNSA